MTAPQTTADQALSTIASEFSASASQPLLDNDGSKFSLRGAIGRILWKVNFLLPLLNRPAPPIQPDDLYGHVLSLRAENLINQTILTAMASKLGVDVVSLRAEAIASFTPPAS